MMNSVRFLKLLMGLSIAFSLSFSSAHAEEEISVDEFPPLEDIGTMNSEKPESVKKVSKALKVNKKGKRGPASKAPLKKKKKPLKRKKK